jgi:hypothetical protein
MSGNPDKASIWGDADVYVAQSLAALNPATIDDPFPATWDLVGLLDGEAGFEESRSRDTTDYFAWGGLLIRTARRNFVLTRKFTALEENAVTTGLVWPGSGPGERRIPKGSNPVKLAFETIDGEKKKRAITRRYAEVEEVGTIKDSETELTKFEITVKIYADADGVLFDIQPVEGAPVIEAIDISPAVATLAVGAIDKLTVLATFADASTRDISDQVLWTVTTPAIASVKYGYAEGLTEGVTNVKATYAGLNDTAIITVDNTP